MNDDVKVETLEMETEEKIAIDTFPDKERHLCLLCNAKYSNQKKLIQHIAFQHDIKFECKICMELFKSNLALR